MLNEPITHRIFVYGSLRRDEYNHSRVNAWTEGKLTHVADGVIEDAELVNLGSYPAIVEGTGQVVGEVYDVPEELFKMIDGMERGAGYIKRDVLVWWKEIDRNYNGDGNPLEASAYFYANPNDIADLPRIPSGDWSLRDTQ